ncbi:FxSxx-COOH system tetratricopeptide repeat protein [Actinoplanes sp. NPDC051343]|uniref:FxSxx-COOH system tetratricopeptide repeat protein n=1 Tax=Actinoplanes sp. NPDC051343 TaxID=3363906 RepID=UPI0037AE6C67
MTSGRNGQVVTFYSYKGGTGRTMALANVAWILAANGKRVLAVDWDLESPGLHRFFNPFIDPGVLAGTRGVIDMIREYEWSTTRRDRTPGWIERYACVQRHSFSLDWDFPGDGTLDFLSAGQQNRDYEGVLQMNWDDFYGDQNGGQFFDAMRDDMREHYDYTLIDSRTGNSDIAGICTSHMPDVLVDCFTFSEQGMDGAAQMARQLLSPRPIRVLPVPMRVDPAEKRKADIGRTVAMRQFADLPSGMDEENRQAYWLGVQVPYQAYYSYEETLATFGDVSGASGTLLNAYENLVGHITGHEIMALPAIPSGVRAQINARFERKPFAEADVMLLTGTTADQVWIEWIEHVLVASGFRVVHLSDADKAPASGAQRVRIVSRGEGPAPVDEPDLCVVYTTETAPRRLVAPANSVVIGALSATAAAERVLELVGRPVGDVDAVLAGAPRYPGEEPHLVADLPARNARFTGREAVLLELREQLRSGAAVVLFGTQAVALQGMGGVGKTQLALEYAYRYRAAYDVVAWLNADSEESLESSLHDLGEMLGLQSEQVGADYARAVVQELSRDKRRWLLIFDNADEPEAIRIYLPHGPGHVLITSRNTSWGEQTQSVPVDVFTREESIDHLVQRVERVGTLSREDADLVAEQLADLPIVIAAAAAWLAETLTPVAEYLELIREEGPSAALSATTDRSIARTWDLSLNRLRDRDQAAYRLFQLCSVLAPEIPLDLVYSDEMARHLRPFNPALSERMARGSLVQQINRLALLRLDQRPSAAGDNDRRGQIIIHRVVQNVVRDRMTDEELAEARRQVHQVLVRARPDGEVDDQQNWPRFRMLWPHLDASEAVLSTDEAVRQLLIDRVRLYYLQGDSLAGRPRAELISRLWAEQLAATTAPEAADVLRRQLLYLRFNLANLLRELGDFQRSYEVDEQVLAAQQELLPANHPHVLMTRGGLAADLRGLGRYPEALELDLDTYTTWQEHYGEENERTLSARNNLAVSYRLMGDFRRAAEHDEQTFELRREVLGEFSFMTLASAACLARDWRDAGNFARSADLLEQTVAELLETRGPDSRMTLTTQANYAISLRSLGHIDKSVPLHRATYAKLDQLFGAEYPETVSCRLSLALSLLNSGDAERAIAEMHEIREFYEQRLGSLHPYTLVCANDLAIAERAAGRYAKAREWIEPTVHSLTSVLGPRHPYTLSAEMNFAICETDPVGADDAGDLASARHRLLALADVNAEVFGVNHPNHLRFEANLALMDLAAGDRTAEERVTTLRERMVNRVGESHPIVDGLDHRRYLYRIIDPHQF